MELLGIGRHQLRKIPVGSDYRIRPDILKDAIKADRTAGLKPFCLIGNAGTVNTGAVDPLDILAEIATRYQLWFHVDGAYGAFAALASETRPLFIGIERADSLVLDPHKWLNIPYEAGCILVRNWADLVDTFSLVPSYLSATAEGEEHNHGQYGFELSRSDRALKVWLALRQYGVDRYTKLVENHLALARYLANLVREANDFEIVSEPVLSVCCFRYVPPNIEGRTEQTNAYLNDLNRAIEMALINDGRALVSGTELHGKRVLRVCIVNHRVTREGVEKTLLLLRKFGDELDTRMRKRS
jgi:glutamate/tyrosine decarboxylase-like PLP-dependent enzyme